MFLSLYGTNGCYKHDHGLGVIMYYMTYSYNKSEFQSDEFWHKQVAYTNELAMVIVPKKSFVDGYVMMAPIKQVEFFDELNPNTLEAIWGLVEIFDNALKSTEKDYVGYTLIINRGIPAKQKVPHTHVHFFPHKREEKEHPLYKQVAPKNEDVDPGLEVRLATIKKLLSNYKNNKQNNKNSTATFVQVPGECPEQSMFYYKGVKYPHLMNLEASQKLLTCVNDMVKKDDTYRVNKKGYTLTFPQKNYSRSIDEQVNFEIILIRREEGVDLPRECLTLKKTNYSDK